MKNTISELIYFSPTGTTKTILEKIAIGENIRHTDLTLSSPKIEESETNVTDLVYIGGPVYGGRLQAVMVSRLKEIKGNGRSAVLVVTYGNREYDDALLELKDLAIEIGFKPIAAAAFIGEHSFSTKTLPIALDRPDHKDLKVAEEFKNMIKEKISTNKNSGEENELKVLGTYPYKEIKVGAAISPETDKLKCINCKKCVFVCPTGAIDTDDHFTTDKSLCIKCNACIKICPTGAREWNLEAITDLRIKMNKGLTNRKEPVFFL